MTVPMHVSAYVDAATDPERDLSVVAGFWGDDAHKKNFVVTISGCGDAQYAELFAILEAAKRADNDCITDIYTDSEYAIERLSGTFIEASHQDIVNNIKSHTDRNTNIHVKWALSHAGNEGNKRAEQMASTELELLKKKK